MTSERDADLPELVLEDQETEIVKLLRELQKAVLTHPESSAALFVAFAAEGRAFAQTRSGAALKHRILRSALLERALLVWESASLFVPQQVDRVAPSRLVDAVAAAAASPRRDHLLQLLFASLEER